MCQGAESDLGEEELPLVVVDEVLSARAEGLGLAQALVQRRQREESADQGRRGDDEEPAKHVREATIPTKMSPVQWEPEITLSTAHSIK